MKKIILPVVLVCMIAVAVPAYAFLDYLFGGSQGRDAIDNSAVGDLRAWWTGNPAYQFNPYYSPQQQNPVQNQGAQGGQQMGAPRPNPECDLLSSARRPAAVLRSDSHRAQGMQQYQGAPPGYQQCLHSIPAGHGRSQYQAAPQFICRPASRLHNIHPRLTSSLCLNSIKRRPKAILAALSSTLLRPHIDTPPSFLTDIALKKRSALGAPLSRWIRAES